MDYTTSPLRKPLDEELTLFRDAVRKFLEREIAPHRETWLKNGIVDREAYRKAGEQGFLLMWADEKYGGLGIRDFRFEQILIEEQNRIMETGLLLTLHSRLVASYFDHFGTEEQKQRFLPPAIRGETIFGIAMTEPGAGSDLAGIKARAEDKGDHWLLNGQKTYISNGILGDVFIVAAKTDPTVQHAIGLFIIEGHMPGFSRGNKLRKMGMHSQDTAELYFDNVKLPKENLLGDPARGFYHMMKGLAEERLISSVVSLAMAQQAFKLTCDYVTERKAFGKRIADFQNSRFILARLKTELDVAQVFVDRMVELHNDGLLDSVMAAEGKLMTSELVGRVTDQGVQLHGGAGYMAEYPISQLYTDCRVHRIFAGTSEIMQEIISRAILKEYE
ncbi:MAG: acyl-CoA dehydrogenase family protein [Emcibacter sp.]|nr:acyl-CoA dehydrogenase family protein [Emcibacter sp.]